MVITKTPLPGAILRQFFCKKRNQTRCSIFRSPWAASCALRTDSMLTHALNESFVCAALLAHSITGTQARGNIVNALHASISLSFYPFICYPPNKLILHTSNIACSKNVFHNCNGECRKIKNELKGVPSQMLIKERIYLICWAENFHFLKLFRTDFYQSLQLHNYSH